MSKMLPVQWLRQQERYYCGPASAEMVLKCLGAGSATSVSQANLWLEIQNETNEARPDDAPDGASSCPPFDEQKCELYGGTVWCCWSTTPEALARVLNKQQSNATYRISVNLTDQQATSTLTQSVDSGAPGVALVHGWQHWVVVEGYVSDDANQVIAVCIRDPNFEVSSTHHEVDLSFWHYSYLRAVQGGEYQDHVVTVVGGTAAGAQVGNLPVPSPGESEAEGAGASGGSKPGAEHEGAAPLLPRGKVIELANEVVARMLGRSERWRVALADSDAHSEPLLLEELDRDDDYRYIVTYRQKDRLTARLLLDARTGRFAQAVGIDERGQGLLPYIDPDAGLARVWRRSLRLPGVSRRIVRNEAVGRHPVLVWKPCRQSTSPFMPFYQFSVGDRFVYLRADGAWFSELTTGPA